MREKHVHQNSLNTINNWVHTTPIFIRQVCKVAKYDHHLVTSTCPSTQNNPALTGHAFMLSIFFLNPARNIKCGSVRYATRTPQTFNTTLVITITVVITLATTVTNITIAFLVTTVTGVRMHCSIRSSLFWNVMQC